MGKVPPVIVLLTDFGLADNYVGVMKGVISHICSQAQVIDLSHGIPPQDIYAASFCLAQSYAYFPNNSIFVAVVDPGVGSSRRAIAVHFADEDRAGWFVGPDNGLGMDLWKQVTIIDAVALTNSSYWLASEPSQTFHGRDIFAPIAAHLASGVPLKELGQALNPPDLVPLKSYPLHREPQRIIGSVVYCDQFGNLVTNIPAAWLVPAAKIETIVYHHRKIPYHSAYSQVPAGSLLGLIGSHNYLEIAVNQGNAQRELQAVIGDPIYLFVDNDKE